VYAIGIELAPLHRSFIEQRNFQKTVREITVHNQTRQMIPQLLIHNREQSLW
jgi:hypothetical protein